MGERVNVWSVVDGEGNTITDGLQGPEVCDAARQAAQRIANDREASVWLCGPDGQEIEVTPETETASPPDVTVWARRAVAGDYLARYSDVDSTPETDPGLRCGYSDSELDDARRVLRARGLRLETDDRGILAVEA